jgi:hypothetical protein
MTRTTVHRIAAKLQRCYGGTESGPDGIRVWRIFPGGGREPWRLRCGSGIAGNSGVWWLERVNNSGPNSGPPEDPHGPFRTGKELDRGLRRWRRWEIAERAADPLAPRQLTRQLKRI